MSDPVLAAIIAALATLVATIMQLRASFAREAASRSSSGSSRRKSRAPMLLIFVVLIAAASGGFALSHWITADQRVANVELQNGMKERITELDRTAAQLAQARAAERAEIETETLRRIGSTGVVSLAAVAPCRPAAALAAGGTPQPTTGCTEAEATTVTLCASIPANATVAEVELYTRPVESDTPWSAARVQPGQELDHARFAPSATESSDSETMKLVCQAFSHWASDKARAARMVVHYRL
jgi:hypothetical protein